jgi:hypothetical protein
MGTKDELTVWIRRSWDDVGRKAEIPVSELDSVHWDTRSGGTQAPTPQPFLHGYINCLLISDSEVPHTGWYGGPCPHRIKVCVVMKDNTPEVFELLVKKAGPKPPR